jgi:hypothetical protein
MLSQATRASVVGGAVLIGVLSGCGLQAPAPTEVQISAPSMAVFVEAADVHASLSGTAEEAAKAETLQQQGEQKDYSGCMRRAGFQYDAPVVDWVHPQPRVYAPSWWATPSMADAALGIGYAPAYVPGAIRAVTLPVATSSTANSVLVPWRT